MTAIKVENVGKRYVIDHQKQQGRYRYETLGGAMANFWKRAYNTLRHPLSSFENRLEHEEFWALKDINFEINQGDRVGIIGRNGAGKSTLLKILSRITAPTTGKITIKGRVSSLLEVGTGFHPELTGRENIFLNGAILGMKRQEIKAKFDEIVAFAEVEKFLDTPVKHYSSGMYVRLAFAVAAHLEPEILIVDEVLAVGDAQFQKKCLGKMEEVGREGRTVIFVSHSMPTVTSLCSKAILLQSGQIDKIGLTSEVIMYYYTSGQSSPASANFKEKHIGDKYVRLLKGEIKNVNGQVALEVRIDEPVTVEMTVEVLSDDTRDLVPNFHFYTASGECAFITVSDKLLKYKKRKYTFICYLPEYLLNEGAYFVGLAISSFDPSVVVHFFERNALSFNVNDTMENSSTRSGWVGAMPGIVRPKLLWESLEA